MKKLVLVLVMVLSIIGCKSSDSELYDEVTSKLQFRGSLVSSIIMDDDFTEANRNEVYIFSDNIDKQIVVASDDYTLGIITYRESLEKQLAIYNKCVIGIMDIQQKVRDSIREIKKAEIIEKRNFETK